MLEQLQKLDLDRMDITQAVVLSAFGKSLQAEFAELGVEPPEWLAIRVKEIGREISARNADAIEKRLRELKSRRETLEDAATRRKKIDAEIAKLEAQMA